MKRAKIHPLVIGSAAAVLVFSALGAAALTGVVPTASTRPDLAAAPATGGAAACASCGIVESVKSADADVAHPARVRVTVQMDDGSIWLLSMPSSGFAIGDRVRVVNGSRLERV